MITGSFAIIFNINKLPYPLNKVKISVEIINNRASGPDLLVLILKQACSFYAQSQTRPSFKLANSENIHPSPPEP